MSTEFENTHLTLDAVCEAMESPVGTIVGDQYFTFEISEEDFAEQERVFSPIPNYSIYCYVVLPERSWPGDTWIMIPLAQFSVADSDGVWPTTKLKVPRNDPRKFWIELHVHKRRKITGVASWAHLQLGDKASVHLRVPVSSDAAGDNVELAPTSEPGTQGEANPTSGIVRKPTILKRAVKGIARGVGSVIEGLLTPRPREEYPVGEYRRRRG